LTFFAQLSVEECLPLAEIYVSTG